MALLVKLLAVPLLLHLLAQLTLACGPKGSPSHWLPVPMLANNVTFWSDDPHETSNSLVKRYISIPKTPAEGSMQAPYRYPWPKVCSLPEKAPLRYCFKDKRSATNLGPVLKGAQQIWAPAMVSPEGQVSSMSIEPDSGCPRDEHGQMSAECLCSSRGVSRDSLVISDETKDKDPEWNDGPECTTATTVGYHHAADDEPDRPWRHYIKFCAYEPDDNNRSLQRAIRSMAHEFGHAMGLHHEHQRPDRDDFIKFRCRYVDGWRLVREKVDDDEFGLFEEAGMGDASREEKMAMVCSSLLFALRYLDSLSEFIRADQFDFNGGNLYQLLMERTEWSNVFDYDSIMIYDSTTAAKDKDPAHYTIKRKDGRPLYMGGSKENPKITEGDAARIAQLYPCNTPANRAAQKLNGPADGAHPNWAAVRELTKRFDDDFDSEKKAARAFESRNMTIVIGNSAPMVVTAPRPLRMISEA